QHLYHNILEAQQTLRYDFCIRELECAAANNEPGSTGAVRCLEGIKMVLNC
ncbi:hypothetical protein FRB94_002974, partial [Tulasnella sp. JGI-2019a]